MTAKAQQPVLSPLQRVRWALAQQARMQLIEALSSEAQT
jgi:hypothetical protein